MTIDMTTCSKDRSIELRTMDISCEVVRKTNSRTRDVRQASQSPADEERKEKTAFFLPKGARKVIVFLSLLFLSLLKHPDNDGGWRSRAGRPPWDHSRGGGKESPGARGHSSGGAP